MNNIPETHLPKLLVQKALARENCCVSFSTYSQEEPQSGCTSGAGSLFHSGFEALDKAEKTDKCLCPDQPGGQAVFREVKGMWRALNCGSTEVLKTVLHMSLGYFVHLCNYYSLIVLDSIKNA